MARSKKHLLLRPAVRKKRRRPLMGPKAERKPKARHHVSAGTEHMPAAAFYAAGHRRQGRGREGSCALRTHARAGTLPFPCLCSH